ncbi:MAG TPA: RNA polymerase subunit sigma-70, partial [Mariniflexile sp.]|nr:RNA polymerase subunit sigma-70 [Mariniflexile sp.]
MNAKITTFLNSGLLEKYLLGNTTTAETELVESYVSKYPEVQNAYTTLQYNLEIVSKRNAVEALRSVLSSILDTLDDKPVVT